MAAKAPLAPPSVPLGRAVIGARLSQLLQHRPPRDDLVRRNVIHGMLTAPSERAAGG
jgi:hypothetical protein